MKIPQFELDLSIFTGTTRLESDRIALLRSIQNKGTLTDAAKDVGISYKTACTWLDALNNAADEPLLIASHGGNTRGGTILSDLGKTILERYERIEKLHAKMQMELEIAGELSGFLQRLRLRTSARNHLHGTIVSISDGIVQCIVTIQLSPHLAIQAKVSHNAILEMELSVGSRCAAIFKASSVCVRALEEPYEKMNPNYWRGKVLRSHGDLKDIEITLDLDGQHTVCALVDRDHWDTIQAIAFNQAMISVHPAHVFLMRMD
jgi:molybdate transport system regulatory protein